MNVIAELEEKVQVFTALALQTHSTGRGRVRGHGRRLCDYRSRAA